MENIMIRPDKSIKLIDFGYGEILPRKPNTKLKFCGTPYYMPPEFIKNNYFNGILLLIILIKRLSIRSLVTWYSVL